MSEPKRWLEADAPRDIELLVRAARAEEPSEASLRRSLAAVSAGFATLGAAASAGAAGKAASGASAVSSLAPATASLVAKWVALGATLGTLTVGTLTIAQSSWQKGDDRASAAQSPPKPSLAASPAVEPPARAPTANPPSIASANAPSHSSHSAAGPQAVAPSASVAGADETLIEEVRSVDRARAALAAGRAQDALARLDEYERGFAEHRFAPEALYLRLEALVALGRAELARRTAERLLATYPNSPHAARARALLSKNP